MATYGGTLRRGLPRRPGGEPWPPAGAADAAVSVASVAEPVEAPAVEAVSVVEPAAAPAAPAAAATSVPERAPAKLERDEGSSPSAGVVGEARPLRRGLPRTPGGEPWPPVGAVTAVVASVAAGAPSTAASGVSTPPTSVPERGRAELDRDEGSPSVPSLSERTSVEASAAAAPASTEGPTLRRGLPRIPGGEPWPPEGATARIVTSIAGVVPADDASSMAPSAGSGAATVAAEAAVSNALAPAASSAATASPAASTALAPAPREPLPFTPGVTAGRFAFTRPAPKPAPQRIGPFTRLQWAGAALVVGGGLLFAAAMAVLAVRWFLSTAWGGDFIAAYPGEYHLPKGAPVGVPAWLAWQHFFNFFLMFLIIRSGWRVRREQRPSAYWTGRGKGSHKISLNAWFHQSLDIFWILNGMVFLVLLFATGQWMKVVPTSWEVFPNALSAILQYASLDWPTENGWVNYNSIQQLTYFTTIFIAAPMAVITGFRMSGLWPSKAAFLNKVYPIEWARAVHFPVMLYFVLFIFVHVVLVFATGALRNLNHMFAAQGSVDPNAYADNWTGFFIFVGAIVAVVASWVAARPMVLAPIAKLFGTVSAR